MTMDLQRLKQLHEKATPGPWFLVSCLPDGFRYRVHADPQGHGWSIGMVCNGADAEANARLIAAAPELLDVLVMIRDADDDCLRDGLPSIPSTARRAIDSAIAKTTGAETPAEGSKE